MQRYLLLLRTRPQFRYLWLASVVSFAGDWFNTIALYAIVHELSGSGLAVAGILVGKTLPVFLVSPVAGPLEQREDTLAGDAVQKRAVGDRRMGRTVLG